MVSDQTSSLQLPVVSASVVELKESMFIHAPTTRKSSSVQVLQIESDGIVVLEVGRVGGS